jgi:hypothetical protein
MRVEAVCKPGSVLGRSREMAIPLGCPSPDTSRDLPEQPARKRACSTAETALPSLLLGLAPGGVCRAARVAAAAVRSYRTLSPLPADAHKTLTRIPAGGLLSVALSLGSPPPGVTRHRVSVEPGLSSPGTTPGSGHPTASHPPFS